MKTLILSIIALSLIAFAPAPRDRLTLTINEFPATVVVEGDYAVVVVDTRVLGPVRWQSLPGIPGVEEATVGTTVCIKYLPPSFAGGGGQQTTGPIHVTATAPTLSGAIAKLKAQLGNVMVVPCP